MNTPILIKNISFELYFKSSLNGYGLLKIFNVILLNLVNVANV
jgi:hypothetical protein